MKDVMKLMLEFIDSMVTFLKFVFLGFSVAGILLMVFVLLAYFKFDKEEKDNET